MPSLRRQKATALALAVVLFATSAQAQELPITVMATATATATASETTSNADGVDVLGLTALTFQRQAWSHAMASVASSNMLATGATKDIRLSSGAKTAIIITAIVVGALIIIGVVVVGKPHKHL